jgi:GH18 family chitinase
MLSESYRFALAFAGCALFILSSLGAAHAQDTKVVGYYYGNASRAGYDFSTTPVEMLTHLIYSQAKPNSESGCDLAHPDVDVPNLAALKTLHTKNPRLLILLSVGG